MEGTTELRHLRYFIVVAEKGKLTLAAEMRLRMAQPSLSCQIRKFEDEVRGQPMSRSMTHISPSSFRRPRIDR
jgi:DNA-binding transcriptional LysR family regulator